jgi:hypothetical protein
MYILFNNNCKVSTTLFDTPLKPIIEKMVKHLGHVPLPFRSWDHPYHRQVNTQTQLIEKLELYAKKLNIVVDKNKCLAQDQMYLNYLHRIYEQGYNGNPDWLDYHEHIHLCENLSYQSDLILYHRELSGPLAQPMDLEWLKISTQQSQLQPGDLYLQWAELGKTPYQYWIDNEPDDKERLCSLAKPWVNLYSKLTVAFSNQTPIHNQTNFDLWWQSRSQEWCRHWNIDSWTLTDINSVIVIGKIDNFEELTNILHGNAVPTHVRLD